MSRQTSDTKRDDNANDSQPSNSNNRTLNNDTTSEVRHDVSECPQTSANASQSSISANSGSNSNPKRKFCSLPFGRRKKSHSYATNKCNASNCCNAGKKKNRSSGWAFKLCARTDSCTDVNAETTDNTCSSCVCTAYKKKTDHQKPHCSNAMSTTLVSNSADNLSNDSNGEDIYNGTNVSLREILTNARTSNVLLANNQVLNYPTVENGIVQAVNNYHSCHPTAMSSEVRSVQVRVSELALLLRNQLTLSVNPYPYLARWGEVTELTPGFLNRFCLRTEPSFATNSTDNQQIHTQIDYIHCLVPDLLAIANCSFYWGKMDRYEAERLLDNKPEGTFLLRDSAQEDHLFSVSFRRFDRSLHARIEQWNHRFSFDSHDPGVYHSSTVCGLIEHYKDPSHCMFFEPMLTIPLHRNFPFSLQHLCRASICSNISYDPINYLQLPKRLKNYLKEYHYKQQVRVRRLDGDH